MSTRIPPASEITARGWRIYEAQLRQKLEPGDIGKFVVINIDTGAYELDADRRQAVKRAQLRWPEGLFFAARVGFPAIGHIGARFSSNREK